MFDDISKLTFVVATVVGAVAVFVAGFIIAAEMRSAVAGSATAPAQACVGGAR